jgi:hypothetical protein
VAISTKVPAHRGVAIIAFAAAAIGLASSLLWDAVRYRDGSFIAHPNDLVSIGADKAALFRVAMVADMFGSYLLFLPIVIFLWHKLRPGNELVVDIMSAAGLAYTVIGATGAGIFAAAGPTLIRSYAHAPAGETAHIAVTFATLSDLVLGMWQFVIGLLAAVWWIGVGVLLRDEWRWFARFSILLGVVTLPAVVARYAGVEYVSTAPATLAFVAIAIWPAWLGVRLSSRR